MSFQKRHRDIQLSQPPGITTHCLFPDLLPIVVLVQFKFLEAELVSGCLSHWLFSILNKSTACFKDQKEHAFTETQVGTVQFRCAIMAAVLEWLVKFTSPITKPKVIRSAPRVADRNGAYSIAEIAEHNTPSDAWIIIDDGVYDVSAWGEKHPGGDVVSLQLKQGSF